LGVIGRRVASATGYVQRGEATLHETFIFETLRLSRCGLQAELFSGAAEA
jgi:hypothetical protein